MRRVTIMLLLASALLAACNKSLPPQTEEESEEIQTEEPEIVSLTEEELLSAIDACTPLEDEKHLYADLDFDGKAELLLVTKNAEDLRETWFCSSDGVCECIRTSERDWDMVSVSSIAQNDGTHVFFSYEPIMGTVAHTDIWRLDGSLPTLVAESAYSVCCAEDRVMLMREDYDMTYDPLLDTTLGHTYKTTELAYEDGEYFEYEAKNVPLATVEKMKNSETVFGQIGKDGNVPSKAYLREDRYGYIQCGDLEADRAEGVEGSYCYYTFLYEDDTVVSLVPGTFGTFDNAGIMADHFGDFPVR